MGVGIGVGVGWGRPARWPTPVFGAVRGPARRSQGARQSPGRRARQRLQVPARSSLEGPPRAPTFRVAPQRPRHVALHDVRVLVGAARQHSVARRLARRPRTLNAQQQRPHARAQLPGVTGRRQSQGQAPCRRGGPVVWPTGGVRNAGRRRQAGLQCKLSSPALLAPRPAAALTPLVTRPRIATSLRRRVMSTCNGGDLDAF